MDHPDLNVYIFMEKSIGLKRVKNEFAGKSCPHDTVSNADPDGSLHFRLLFIRDRKRKIETKPKIRATSLLKQIIIFNIRENSKEVDQIECHLIRVFTIY